MRGPATNRAAVTVAYHLDAGHGDAKDGANADTSLISRRVIDIIIENPVLPRIECAVKLAIAARQPARAPSEWYVRKVIGNVSVTS